MPPINDGGSPITGYLVEHRRTGSPHWVRATPLLVPFPELTLSGLEPGWRYQFRISAENAVGMSDPGELSEPLTVTLQRSAITAPRFTQELDDMIALENEKTEFVVHFLGQPPPKISWFKDGFEIFSSRRTRILTENDRSVLTIHQTALTDEGEIKCTATNKAGHASTKARLTLEAPPSIRLPRNYEDGLLFELGEVIRLKVSIAGRPTPLVFWTHNGESIQNGERYEIENNDKFSMLKITEAARSDRGEYQVKVVNKIGEDIASFLVTVTDKPSAPGKARVVMTLGRSVTLSWKTPEDDGGCKIGNYIVEYYRLGWNVWLKAATTRQCHTILGDLIEGSEYKFRVKAESPYGVSDPSEETDTIFIPDPKRGITSPSIRSRSQPRDIFEDGMLGNNNMSPLVPRKPKPQPRSQSSSRAETAHYYSSVPFDTEDGVAPVRPQRTKPKTPETSPYPVRKSSANQLTINQNMFDRSSIARDLAYGSPEITVKRPDTNSGYSSTENIRKSEEETGMQKENHKPSHISFFENKSAETVSNFNKSPTPSRRILSNNAVTFNETSKSQRENSPLSNKDQNVRSLSDLYMDDKQEPLTSHRSQPLVNNSIRQNERNKSPIRTQVEELHKFAELSNQRRQKSPSPKRSQDEDKFSNMQQRSKEMSPSPFKQSAGNNTPSPVSSRRSPRENNDNFTGSSEFMLVLYPDENNKGMLLVILLLCYFCISFIIGLLLYFICRAI